MKKVYLLAAAAAMFAACSNNDGAESAEKAEAQAQAQQIAVGFDAYQGRATTRAVTDLALITGSDDGTDGGFGVFAYYTDNNDYDGQVIPNFMYNQPVRSNSGAWGYEPVKYWPNEYGNTAIAEETDRVSFFAYAPFIAAVASTGKVAGATKNIIGFTRNNAHGDPLVKYVVDLNPATSVDLVWGTQPTSNSFTAKDGTTYTATGLPWLNIKRPAYSGAAAEKVKFQFEHALAQLNVQVDHYADVAAYAADNNVNGKTRIWIRSISFTGFTTQGALNLNNITTKEALWMGLNGDDLVTGEEVAIFDGRKDGKEATAAATNEKVTGLNPNLIQSVAYTIAAAAGTDNAGQAYAIGDLTAGTLPGVVSIAQNLFNPEGVAGYVAQTAIKADEPIFVIPTGDAVKVTIAYDVETVDDNLSTFLSDNKTHGSSVSNVITKTITGFDKMDNGKKYTIKLHLGMNSVKFDAAVSDWGANTDGTADHPAN